MTIRQLLPGAQVPLGAPRRYINKSNGYVRLRWKVGINEYVETYEHRLDGDRITDAPQIHHRNEDRQDNRRENLMPLTPKGHREQHRTLDYALIARLYGEGLGTPTIARRTGWDAGAIWRALKDQEIETRSKHAPAVNRLNVDLDEIRRLHAQGMRAAVIAERLGVSRIVIARRFVELGLSAFPPGRPSAKASRSRHHSD